MPRPKRVRQEARNARSRLVLLLAIIAVAAFFRLYDLDSIPPGLYVDEAQNGLDAERIHRGERFPLWVEFDDRPEQGREPMYHYLMALVFSFTGPSIVALRGTSALIGIVTVIFGFFASERLFGTRFALIAAFVLATLRWHVHWSRIGFRAILVPLMIVLVVGALMRYRDRPSVGRAILLGAVGGLGMYTYPSYWIVPVALAIPVGVALIRQRREERRRHTRLGVVALMAGTIVVSPLGVFAAAHPERFFSRAAETSTSVTGSSEPSSAVLDNTRKVLLMLHVRGDELPRHNIPGKPLLDPVSGIAFLLGAGLALDRARKGDPAWIGVFALWLLPLLPSIVTGGAPHALRTIGAIPSVVVLIAMPFDRFLELVTASRHLKKQLVGLTAAIVLIGIAALNGDLYFRVWPRDPATPRLFHVVYFGVFDKLAGLTSNHDVFVSPRILSPAVRFLNLARDGELRPIEGPDYLLRRNDPPRDRIIATTSQAEISMLVAAYPRAQYLGNLPLGGRVYRIQANDLERELPDAIATNLNRLFDTGK